MTVETAPAVAYLIVRTLVLWPLFSALAIFGWRTLDSYLTAKGYWT